jgi:probable F420-dependent oxidoreductase
VKLWLVLPFLPTARLAELAVLAEQVGFEGVAIGDHVCVPDDLSSVYPYSGRVAELPIDTEFPAPFVLAAGLGAVTSTLRFMTYVYLVPLRHPILLARDVATAAALTGGRIDFGAGVGWMEEEFRALGVPFHRRGALMDESLPLLRRFWNGEVVEHEGHGYSFPAVAMRPAPPAPMKVFVGGYSAAAVRRAATLGDGWVAVNPTLDELAVLLTQIERARQSAGRGHEPFEVRTGLRGELRDDRIRAVRDLGVDALFVMPWQLGDRRWIYDVTVDAVADALPGFMARAHAVIN